MHIVVNALYLFNRSEELLEDIFSRNAIKKNNVTIISTLELLFGLLYLKKNEITESEFINKITEGGIVKFSK